MIDETKIIGLPQPVQNMVEWMAFLRFTKAILDSRQVTRPRVVEIGVHTGCQKAFWEQFFNARYLGIDISDHYAKPDILGDSTSVEVREEVNRWLDGWPIDVLFIDGDHSYEIVKQDYENYAPMTRHIIAFHDIFCIASTVGRAWNEVQKYLQETQRGNLFVTFGSGLSRVWEGNPRYQLGIGVIVKE